MNARPAPLRLWEILVTVALLSAEVALCSVGVKRPVSLPMAWLAWLFVLPFFLAVACVPLAIADRVRKEDARFTHTSRVAVLLAAGAGICLVPLHVLIRHTIPDGEIYGPCTSVHFVLAAVIAATVDVVRGPRPLSGWRKLTWALSVAELLGFLALSVPAILSMRVR